MFWKNSARPRPRALFCLPIVAMIAALCLSGCGSSAPGVHIVASATTVDAGDSVNLTASVAGGVTWKIASGGGALSKVTTSSATYTAPDPVAAVTVVVTATSITSPTKSSNITLTVPAEPSVTTSSLAAGTVGTPYSVTLAGSGGITPYTWSVSSGTLPAGLNLAPSTGVISGTPTAPAVPATLTFQLTDSGKATPLKATSPSLTLTINPAPAIVFTNASLPAGTYNVSYTASAAATGGAGVLTYSKTGTWPTGLNLNASTGAITGTPTAVGSFAAGVTAADAFGDTATQSYTIVVSYPAIIITPPTLPTGYVGLSYTSTAPAATGGNGGPYTWTVTSGLPSLTAVGLTLNSSTGVISGATPILGSASFTLTATDSASNAGTTSTLSITIKPGVSITTAATLPAAYTNSLYSQTLAASGGNGGPYNWTLSVPGNLATFNLNLSGAGVISGTPTTTGTASFTAKAIDSAGNIATEAFSINVLAGVSVAPATLPAGYQGAAYPGATLVATGGTGMPYTWTVTGTNTLTAAGLSLSSAGVISGIPTTSGTINFTAQATDSVGNTGTQTFSLTVAAALAITTPATLPGGTVGVAYSTRLNATGGSGADSWSTDGPGTASLAAIGLTLSPAGLVAGVSPSSGTANFTATVADSASHTAQLAFTVSITNLLTITTTNPPAAYTGSAYSQTLQAAGGSGSGYTFSVSAPGNLATFNLSLSGAGVISGTPTSTTGSPVSFTAKVTDSASNTATATITIPVYSPVTLAPPAGALAAATTNVPYTATITASGGSGSYSNWKVTGLSDNLTSNSSGGTLTISGTPNAAATAPPVSFNVSVQDNNTGVTFGPFTYTIVVNNPAPLILPNPNPATLGSANNGVSYFGTITATGGVGPYTWTVDGNTVPTGSSSIGLSGTITGLFASNLNGTSTLQIAGIPSGTGTVTLSNVTVMDSEVPPVTTAPQTYTINVNSGATLSSQIFENICGGGVSLPTFTVTLSNGSGPVGSPVSTDSNGNFTITGIPDGTYTLTPSISGPSSVFFPASQSVTVSGGVVTSNLTNFNVTLGYTVTGTVSYTQGDTGQIYLSLNNNNCGGGNSQPGTSISGPGPFTIRGVAPGNYTLQSNMDILGNGAPNDNDPSGSTAVGISTFTPAPVTVTMTNPSAVAFGSSTPGIQEVSPGNNTAVIVYTPITTKDNNGNKVEQAASYTLHWSTSSSACTTSSTGKTFKAIGSKGTDLWLVSGLTNGTTYYFCAQGTAPGATASDWSAVSSGVKIGASTTGNKVTGTVTFTGTATGPLYVGFFDQNTNTPYAAVVGSKTPPPTSPAAYTVYVPTGSNYYFFGIIDQNNDGLVDAGDITNTNNGNDNTNSVNITEALSGEDLTLSGANSNVSLTTQHSQQNGTNDNYSLNFDVRGAVELPVAVTLTSGPNVIVPQDFGVCTSCGSPQINFNIGVNGARPNAGVDAYGLTVTYATGAPDTPTETVQTVLDAFATNLAPTGTTSDTTPTFSWSYPADPSLYTYSFYISGNNGTVWQIPGNNSNSNGFPDTVTQIVWGTDPTGDLTNTPDPSVLTSGQQYNWQIQVQDSNGNSTQQQVSLTP